MLIVLFLFWRVSLVPTDQALIIILGQLKQ